MHSKYIFTDVFYLSFLKKNKIGKVYERGLSQSVVSQHYQHPMTINMFRNVKFHHQNLQQEDNNK